MGLGALLEQTWIGLSGLVRSRTATTLFRRAEQCRGEGRYVEAAALVAQGLEQAPGSIVGHLLSAYLSIARREIEPARQALLHVLTLDAHHPRALLGLARIALEDGDPDAARPLLDRALQIYPEFPEAQALRDMIGTWSSDTGGVPAAPHRPTPPPVPEQRSAARDLIVMRRDGSPIGVGGDVEAERATSLAQHMTHVRRMADATLARAGMGGLIHGIIETGAGATFVLSEGDLLLSATLGRTVEIGPGLAQLRALRAALGVAAEAR